jgi:hypothetical protein
MVKSTRNVNSLTPIVALASFDRDSGLDASRSIFDAVLAKPLERSDVCAILPRLGFISQAPPRRSAGSLSGPSSGQDGPRSDEAAPSSDTAAGTEPASAPVGDSSRRGSRD